jgi:hypothetical protein
MAEWRYSFTPRPFPSGTHCLGSWVGLRADLDAVERKKFLAPAGNRTPVFLQLQTVGSNRGLRSFDVMLWCGKKPIVMPPSSGLVSCHITNPEDRAPNLPSSHATSACVPRRSRWQAGDRPPARRRAPRPLRRRWTCNWAQGLGIRGRRRCG